MKHSDQEDCTALLLAWQDGEPEALEQLTPLVYDELRRLARAKMRGERVGHTLQTTALVNEAWLRLADITQVQWQSRAHFFAVAAEVMRRVLVDHAHAHQAQKRGGTAVRVEFDEALPFVINDPLEIIALDEALKRLTQFHPQLAQVVVMRFFADLDGKEIAEVLGVTPGRVSQLWKLAQAWLRRELGGAESASAEQKA